MIISGLGGIKLNVHVNRIPVYIGMMLISADVYVSFLFIFASHIPNGTTIY